MFQASVFQCLRFDFSSLLNHCLIPAEVDISRGQVAQALVIAAVVS